MIARAVLISPKVPNTTVKQMEKITIFQCMRAQAGALSQMPKMSLLEKLREIPGILGG